MRNVMMMADNLTTIRGYRMNRRNDSAEILLYGPIGPSFWGDSITAVQFRKDLKALGEVKAIDLRINSEGGSVFDAAAIYNTLKEHPASVTAHVDGMALSAASVILQAGDQRVMAENAFVMIHDPWSMVVGDASAMRREADLLDSIKDTIVDVYVARSGQDRTQVERMMTDETWMTSEEALQSGFVDQISENLKVAASFDAARYGYRRTPGWAEQRSKADAPPPDLVRRARLAHMTRAQQRHKR